MTIPILILAAGASRRMGGRDKLLEDVHGLPLLRHVVSRALATQHPVIVTLSGNAPHRAEAIEDQPVAIVEISDADQGMSASLRAGLDALPKNTPAVVIALADMPEISKDDYICLIKAFQADPDANIQRAASQDGVPGNPVLLPRWAFQDQNAFSGDKGARDLLRKHADRVRLLPLPGNHALIDLDTPQDWQQWRKR